MEYSCFALFIALLSRSRSGFELILVSPFKYKTFWCIRDLITTFFFAFHFFVKTQNESWFSQFNVVNAPFFPFINFFLGQFFELVLISILWRIRCTRILIRNVWKSKNWNKVKKLELHITFWEAVTL